jgi:hypothetical protein
VPATFSALRFAMCLIVAISCVAVLPSSNLIAPIIVLCLGKIVRHNYLLN